MVYDVNKQDLIETLNLSGHFEGGYFRQTFKSAQKPGVTTSRGQRSAMTSIFYMLTDDSPVDAFHTKHSDGIQFFLMGAPITYHLIHPDGVHETVILGPDLSQGHQLQLAVAGGTWKAAELPAGEFGLVSEVVAPGWEMEDMIQIKKADLTALYPQHAAVIDRLGDA